MNGIRTSTWLRPRQAKVIGLCWTELLDRDSPAQVPGDGGENIPSMKSLAYVGEKKVRVLQASDALDVFFGQCPAQHAIIWAHKQIIVRLDCNCTARASYPWINNCGM